MKTILTPREFAEAIGVSESSLKRWTDSGVIRATRTAGGHRRIPIAEAIRYLRETRTTLARPELLGLPELGSVGDQILTADEESELLLSFLREGRDREARGLLMSLYLRGRSVAALCDGPIHDAMKQLGELWAHHDNGIFIEHRATDICFQALNQLRLTFEVSEDASIAVGGAPAADIYALPSLAAATVLTSIGLRTVNLGPDTPARALAQAAEIHHARLVWLSVSELEDPDGLTKEINYLTEKLDEIGVSLILGGRAHGKLRLQPSANLHVGTSMSELAAFAKGILSTISEQ